MGKRDRRGSILSKSKARRVKKAAVARPGKSVRSGPEHRKKNPDSSLKHQIRTLRQRIVSRPLTASVRPSETGASTPRAGTATQGGASGREVRTPPPSPTAGGLEEINLVDLQGRFGGRARRRRVSTQLQTASGQFDAGAPTQRGGTGRRNRTPLPLLIAGELEEINLFGGRARRRQSAQNLEEAGERFRHVQEFVRNPNIFELRGKELDTSSTPEEIATRMGEVRYQIEVIRSLLTVLTEELSALEQARPQSSADRTQTIQS
jgi:hypothetical protein